jgi:hypothetical protein
MMVFLEVILASKSKCCLAYRAGHVLLNELVASSIDPYGLELASFHAVNKI